ncbi:MAG: carbohydrate binding domain-containing protein [Solirubrobacterales bacterium]|nr:carbohydrate binding domain-containing protein [Solirubrobacterales bacterium]
MKFPTEWVRRGVLVGACLIASLTVGAAAADASSPIYWGATIGSSINGDPYMPSGCEENPPLSTAENQASPSTCTQTDSGNGSDPWSVFTGQDVANHSLSIMPVAQAPYDNDGWTDFSGAASLFDTIRSKGAIPLLTVQTSAPGDAPNPSQWSDANIADLPAGSPDSSDQNPGDHQYCDANGQCRTFDDYFNSWARAAAAYQHPFFLRLDQEGNGSWFDWGQGSRLGNTASDYIAMWKHIHDIFDCVPDGSYTPPRGCKPALNVTWVWAPNNGGWGQGYATPPAETFPSGVDPKQRPYVDWTGLDAYDRPDDQGDNMWSLSISLHGGGSTELADSYQEAVDAAPSAPMMLSEFASDESPDGNPQEKADWITDALTNVIPNSKQIKAALYYNEQDTADGAGSHELVYPVESSQQSIDAFSAGINDGYYQGADTSNSFGGAVQDGQPIQPIGGFAGPNLLKDPGFEKLYNANPWQLVSYNGADANASLDPTTAAGGAKSVQIQVPTATPGSPANVQWRQAGIQLYTNRKYTLSFWAKASDARQIGAGVQQRNAAKTYGAKTVNLDGTWRKYSVTVPAQQIASSNSMVEFQLADDGGTVWLDNVSLHAD